jgi:hypothetical protein
MQDFQQRVISEADDLLDKLTKLNDFLNSDRVSVLSREELERMQRQSLAMSEYHAVLMERIAAFK